MLGRLDSGFGKELLQARHFRLQGKRVLRRAADFLRLLDRRLQLAPAPVELPLQGTRPGTGIHLRPAQLLAACFGRVRTRPFPLRAGVLPLVLRTPVSRRTRRCCLGGRPNPVVALNQRQA